jgi:hypothetical protein
MGVVAIDLGVQVQSHYPHDLATIADPNLKGNFSLRSMKTIVHVALRSVALQGANRPTMSDVVGEIRSAMKLMELGPDNRTTDHGTLTFSHPTSDNCLVFFMTGLGLQNFVM